MHKLADRDIEQTLHFSMWTRHENGILHNTRFSDESHFRFDEDANGKTFHQGHEHPRHFRKREIWRQNHCTSRLPSLAVESGRSFPTTRSTPIVTSPCRVMSQQPATGAPINTVPGHTQLTSFFLFCAKRLASSLT
jgi:hypothetical protein